MTKRFLLACHVVMVAVHDHAIDAEGLAVLDGVAVVDVPGLLGVEPDGLLVVEPHGDAAIAVDFLDRWRKHLA